MIKGLRNELVPWVTFDEFLVMGNGPFALALLEMDKCKTGKRLCGECKKECAELLTRFLTEHQKKREKAKKLVGKFLK